MAAKREVIKNQSRAIVFFKNVKVRNATGEIETGDWNTKFPGTGFSKNKWTYIDLANKQQML